MPPQCQHPPQLFCPHVARPCSGASPTLGPKQFPFPWAVLPSHTQRPGSAAPPPPHTPARPWEQAPAAGCPPATVTPALCLRPSWGSALEEQPARLGSYAALTPARGLPSRPSLTGRRLGGRRWHRRARAAAVDDVVGDARVLGDAEHIVPGAGARVPHQEHPVPLALQQRHRLLPTQPPPVPATPLLRVEVARHGRLRAYTLGRRSRARPSSPGARRPADRLGSQPHSSARNGGGGRRPSPPEMTRSLPLGGCREGDRGPPLGEGQSTALARTAHAASWASPRGGDRDCRGWRGGV